MSLPKTGKSFPEKGNIFPDRAYALTISGVLKQNLGNTRRAIKTLVGWTGASERTVKNWLSGTSGPSGEHLIALIGHSDEVLEVLLLLAGRHQFVARLWISEAKAKLIQALKILN